VRASITIAKTTSRQAAIARQIGVCVSVLCCLLVGCSKNTGAPNTGTENSRPQRTTTVVFAAAELRTIKRQVEAIGTTRANESVTITAKVTAKVNNVTFDDGMLVDTGTVLVELTNEEETALLAEAQANVDDTKSQYTRLRDLLKKQSIPVSQVDEAKARYSGAQARYQSMLARMDDRLIRAPFTGVLGFREVSAGTLITPGTPISTLDDLSTIKLDFSVPEVYIGLLRPGMEIEATSVAFAGRQFSAQVRTVGSRVDPVTRALVVRAVIDNSDLALRPGMLMSIQLTTAEREALMIPASALVQLSQQSHVYTSANGIAQKQPVQFGERYDGWIEIVSGLSAGEQVVVEGTVKVRDGAPIIAIEPVKDLSKEGPVEAIAKPNPSVTDPSVTRVSGS